MKNNNIPKHIVQYTLMKSSELASREISIDLTSKLPFGTILLSSNSN